VIKTEAGPKVVDRTEATLADLAYDGAKLSFGVDNGEEMLVGEVKQVDDHFEGRWISSKTKHSGTLTLTRKP
jgi:hypothetical protein